MLSYFPYGLGNVANKWKCVCQTNSKHECQSGACLVMQPWCERATSSANPTRCTYKQDVRHHGTQLLPICPLYCARSRCNVPSCIAGGLDHTMQGKWRWLLRAPPEAMIANPTQHGHAWPTRSDGTAKKAHLGQGLHCTGHGNSARHETGPLPRLSK